MSNTDTNIKPAAHAAPSASSVVAPAELPPNPADLPVAAVADEYPMSDAHERASMAASIAKQGILIPITIWRDDGNWWLLDWRRTGPGFGASGDSRGVWFGIDCV